MKQRVTIAALVTTFCVGVVIILFSASPGNKILKNNHRRSFLAQQVVILGKTNLKYNSYYLAGTTDSTLYLGNITAPLYLLKYNRATGDTTPAILEKPAGITVNTTNILIDSSRFYVLDWITREILWGDLKQLVARRYSTENPQFAEAVPVSPGAFVFRAVADGKREYVLSKKNRSSNHVEAHDDILEKQVDGFFCTDGVLHYDRKTKRLVYIYFYRNEFITMDTSLNIIYRSHTIDTISRAKLKVDEIKSDQALTLSAPAIIVNRKSSIDENHLYVNSTSISPNESEIAFSHASVIDVYDLSRGTYKASFYLPDANGKKVREFRVSHDTLFAMYDKELLIYRVTGLY